MYSSLNPIYKRWSLFSYGSGYDSVCILATSVSFWHLLSFVFLSYLLQIYFPYLPFTFLALFSILFNIEDFNFYVVTFYFIGLEVCIMLNSHSQDYRNSLVFSSGAFIHTFSCLIFDAFRMYFGIRMEVGVQLNFFPNDNPSFQYHSLNK